jgi:hypothetical protein
LNHRKSVKPAPFLSKRISVLHFGNAIRERGRFMPLPFHSPFPRSVKNRANSVPRPTRVFPAISRSYLLFPTIPMSNSAGFRGFAESPFRRLPVFSGKTQFFAPTFSRPIFSGADILAFLYVGQVSNLSFLVGRIFNLSFERIEIRRIFLDCLKTSPAQTTG